MQEIQNPEIVGQGATIPLLNRGPESDGRMGILGWPYCTVLYRTIGPEGVR